MKYIILYLIFCSYSFSQDIADFSPLNFEEIDEITLVNLYNKVEKSTKTYYDAVSSDYVIFNRDTNLINPFLGNFKKNLKNLTSIEKIIKTRDDFDLLFNDDDLKNEKLLRHYYKNIISYFNEVIEGYNNRLNIRADLGNTDGENFTESISPSINFSYFYILQRDESIDKVRSHFWDKIYTTIGINLNINGQSNFNLDSLAELTKLLNYASDINLYLNSKFGYGSGQDKFKVIFGLNGGISYYKKRNIEFSTVGGKSLLFGNGYLGFWFKIPKVVEILIGSKLEYRQFINDIPSTYKLSKLDNAFTLNIYGSLNISDQFGIVVNYLAAPTDLSQTERLQIKLSKAFSLAKF